MNELIDNSYKSQTQKNIDLGFGSLGIAASAITDLGVNSISAVYQNS